MNHPASLSRREFLGGAAAAALGAVSPAGAGRPIGCYTRPWDQLDYRAALDAIAEAGFKHAGLMTAKSKSKLVLSAATTPEEAEQVAAELKKRDLSVPSVYGGDIGVARGLQAGLDDLRRLTDSCAAVGAKDLLMGGTGNPKLFDHYYKAVAEGCDYAAERNLGISVKPHGGLNADGAQCRKICELVGKKNFGVWYDPGNILYYSDAKLDPVKEAGEVDGRVVGISIKDYRHPKNVALTPGTGQVDFPAVMARLKQGGFLNGPLVIECLAPGDPPQLLEEARKARRFVEDLVARL
jgi:sugar phosphate isomerase/epimerase